MRTKPTFVAVLLIIGMGSGCSTTSDELESSTSAVRSQKSYSDNYQAVFRRLSDTARRCQTTVGAAALTVDAQLYSELGFGEVTMSMVSTLYPRNYYWKAKIEKDGSASKLSVTSGNTVAQERFMRDVIRWADGDPNC